MSHYKLSPQNLTTTITLRCTPQQHAAWTANARACGMSLNAYIRCACSYLAANEDNAGVARFYNFNIKKIEDITDSGQEQEPEPKKDS